MSNLNINKFTTVLEYKINNKETLNSILSNGIYLNASVNENECTKYVLEIEFSFNIKFF